MPGLVAPTPRSRPQPSATLETMNVLMARLVKCDLEKGRQNPYPNKEWAFLSLKTYAVARVKNPKNMPRGICLEPFPQ